MGTSEQSILLRAHQELVEMKRWTDRKIDRSIDINAGFIKEVNINGRASSPCQLFSGGLNKKAKRSL